jgi:hypothetical protein
LVVVPLLLLLLAPAMTQALIYYDFNANAQGWVQYNTDGGGSYTGPMAPTHQTSGGVGNSGFIEFYNPGSTPYKPYDLEITLPNNGKMLGNLTQQTFVSVDFYRTGTWVDGGAYPTVRWMIDDGVTWWITDNTVALPINDLPGGTWTTESLQMTAANFSVPGGSVSGGHSFDYVLANYTNFGFILYGPDNTLSGYHDGAYSSNGRLGIDNVRTGLADETGAVVPEPSSLALLALMVGGVGFRLRRRRPIG